MALKPDLKPCPFCAGAANIRFSFGAWEVSCSNCAASMMLPCGIGADYEPSKQQAADAWNTRVDQL